MDFPPVLTKTDFVRRYQANEFGNRSPTWDTVNEFLAWGRQAFGTGPSYGLYHLRNRVAGGATYYDLKWSHAVALWCDQKDKKDFYCSAMCPTERTTFQGEVMQAPPSTGKVGLALYYTTVAKPMRQALLEGGKQVYGLLALGLLQRYLCPNSYEWMQVLLDRYPEHCVEFTCLDHCWGSIPGYNTLWWEIRKY